jgi:predicted HTH transcriptional regulator
VLEIVPFNGRDVIVCQIPESRSKPHYFLGAIDQNSGENTRVYIRVHDKTLMASKEVVKILRDENPESPPLKVMIGENEKRLFQYLEQHERISVREFGRLVNISDRRTSRLLVRLVRAGVIRIHTHEKEEYYTLAYDVNS